MMSDYKHTNRLIHAGSPYLLQHAHNPVDWYEWGDEAMEKAKRDDKLLLISIGYSSCHWCHVMAHESFEKEDTASIMNERYVCVKIDREERPDVDQIYMDAVQLLTGRGGWPLHVFALPDGRPLHGGTYFPKNQWEEVLWSVSDFYLNHKDKAIEFAANLANGIRDLDHFLPAIETSDAYKIVEQVLPKWSSNFDLIWGGFNHTPKFPIPNNWELFLLFHYYSKENTYRDALLITLEKMAEGGINDSLAGGFARYSTDRFWKVPHFEKMLYDNAQLMALYANAYAFSKNELLKKVVWQIHHFIQTEMTSPTGGFYAALDADSEGVEGKYYVWQQSELKHLLGEKEPLFSLYYSIESGGNWEHGNNILYKTKTDQELEKISGKTIDEIEMIMASCNKILWNQRNKRIHPGLDNKIICSWNALMVEAYAIAYMVLGDETFLHAATRSANFILNQLWDQKRLLRVFPNGKNPICGFAEDYACLCASLIKMYEASGIEKYLFQSLEILEKAIELFYDESNQLFYFKSKQDVELITRKIDVNDDVIPSANSILARCLYYHSFYFNKTEHQTMAAAMVNRIQTKMEKFPSGFSNWMQLILIMENGLNQVIVTGPGSSVIRKELNARYLPDTLILSVESLSNIPLLMDKQPNEQTLIYVCKNRVCSLAVKTIEEALVLLKLSD